MPRIVKDLTDQAVFNVRDYGAKGDGITDDSAAFLAAYRAAASYSLSVWASVVYFPAGDYLITTDNFFGQIDFTTLAPGGNARYRISFIGDGYSSKIIFKPTSSSDVWLYDNGASSSSNNRLVRPHFEGLSIYVDVANLSGGATFNGFRLYGSSPNPAQEFTFDHCFIQGVDGSVPADIVRAGTLLVCRGTVNADRCKFVNCMLLGWKTLLSMEGNTESVCHEFIGTDAVVYGDCFYLTAGSNITVHGGSYSMYSEATSYFLNIRSSASVITIGTFTFSGGRLEQDYSYSNPSNHLSNILLINAVDQPTAYQNSAPVIVFNGWNFYPATGSGRDSIKVDAAIQAKVLFNGCSFNSTVNQINAFSSVASIRNSWNGPFATIDFVNGQAIAASKVSFTDSDSQVRISARNCNVLDYDLSCNGFCDVVQKTNKTLKVATINGKCWPDVGTSSPMSVILPPNAVIKSIKFRKTAYGASGSDYQLYATDQNAAVIYCISSAAAQNTLHEASVDNLNVVADTSAKQYVYIICVAGKTGSATSDAMQATDFAIVEYY